MTSKTNRPIISQRTHAIGILVALMIQAAIPLTMNYVFHAPLWKTVLVTLIWAFILVVWVTL